MNTETIHILIAACTLIAAGITSFPYRLWKIQCKLPPKTKAILPP